MKLLMAIGLIMALVAPAFAEPTPVLYPGSRCFRVSRDGEKLGAVTVKVPALLVAATEAAEAHADHLGLGRCVDQLTACRGSSKPDNKWLVASRWAAVGVAIGAAFIGGAWLGSR